MSYRLHLSVYDKDQLEELRSLQIDDAEMGDGDDGVYFLPDMLAEANEKDDFLPGKMEILTRIGTPLFKNATVQQYFEHYKPKVISEQEFLEVIEAFRERIHQYYENLIKNPKLWEAEIRDKADTWEAPYVKPYDLNNNRKFLVGSYDDEYQIWDLIRIYKSIDWEKDSVVIYGW